MRTLYAAIASICIPFSAQVTFAQNKLPDATDEKTIVFTAPDQSSARAAATNWITKHGGIYLHQFTVVQAGDKFVATITYEDAP